MLGRTPGNIRTVRPLKDGVIADFNMTEAMLQHFIRKVHTSRFRGPALECWFVFPAAPHR